MHTHETETYACISTRSTVDRSGEPLDYHTDQYHIRHTRRYDSLAVSRLIDKHATRVHAGAPGLLALQYVVDRITPYTLAAALEQSLRDTLKDMRISQARRLNLKRFDVARVSLAHVHLSTSYM